MPSLASLLVAASAGVVLFLGSVHLFYTFHGTQLDPRDGATIQSMQQTPLVLTRKTTVWRAWIGFNASHSFGLLLFALIFGWLALAAPQILFGSVFLQALGLVFLLSCAVLASRYWFDAPFRGIVLATVLYAAGLVAAIF
jgi:hypothetical protein